MLLIKSFAAPLIQFCRDSELIFCKIKRFVRISKLENHVPIRKNVPIKKKFYRSEFFTNLFVY